MQVEELRMRLAQFRRKLPQYRDGDVPPAGVSLTGPFDVPDDWYPSTFQETQKPPHTTNPIQSEDVMSPQDYLEWLKLIPLAETAACAPLSHMVPRNRMAPKTAGCSRLFEADTVPL
jgi:hypothetical protein